MFEWRIYRAGLVPVLLAVVVVAFSLANPPRPLVGTLAPDAFDGTRAFGTLRDLAARYPSRRPGSAGDLALARVVRQSLAARAGSGRRSQLVPFSDGAQLAPLALRRTLETAVNTEVGHGPGAPSVAVQFAHLALPLTVGEQGPLLAAGLPAALLSVSGERGPSATERVDQNTLQQWGRAALRAVAALDSAPDLTAAPSRDLDLAPKVLPGWTIAVLLGSLIIGPLLVSIDGVARARRRREPVARGLRWALTLVFPFLAAGLFSVVAGRLGLLGAAPPHPPLPSALPAKGLALGAVGLVFALCWLARRPLLARLGEGSAGAAARAPGTGPVLLLMLSLLAG